MGEGFSVNYGGWGDGANGSKVDWGVYNQHGAVYFGHYLIGYFGGTVIRNSAALAPEFSGLTGAATGIKWASKSGAKNSTETVQRWMSKAELNATQETGLLRGGRDGTHYVTDSANSNALRARQRSALPQTPEVKVTFEVPQGSFSEPSKVDPAFNMPGGGMERTASGNIPVTGLRGYGDV